jgi:hypothetical protein
MISSLFFLLTVRASITSVHIWGIIKRMTCMHLHNEPEGVCELLFFSIYLMHSSNYNYEKNKEEENIRHLRWIDFLYIYNNRIRSLFIRQSLDWYWLKVTMTFLKSSSNWSPDTIYIHESRFFLNSFFYSLLVQ